jgi:hypothetical protein
MARNPGYETGATSRQCGISDISPFLSVHADPARERMSFQAFLERFRLRTPRIPAGA